MIELPLDFPFGTATQRSFEENIRFKPAAFTTCGVKVNLSGFVGYLEVTFI